MTTDASRGSTSVAAAGPTPADTVAEEIAAKDLNNLYLTSCYFADPEKYRGFCAQYAVMRVVDDRIDDIPSRSALTPEERRREHQVVAAWRQGVEDCYAGRSPEAATVAACDHPSALLLFTAFGDSIRSFPVPVSLWRNFFRAMARDIERPRFATYGEFLEYAEGATVAPTTIYLYLIAAARGGSEPGYRPPEGFDLISCGRDLGLFAYLGHILRDLAKDLAVGDEGLLYLARDDMDRFGVSEASLFEDLKRRQASPTLRALTEEILGRAWAFLDKGRSLMGALQGKLTPDCAFVLELIVSLYERILERVQEGSFDTLAHSPRLSLEEKASIALSVAQRLGFHGMPRVIPDPAR